MTRLETARRATVGKNVLDVMALIFLCCSTGFWLVIHWGELVGPSMPTWHALPQIVVALAMTAIYALALPLLLSMLVPTTPAGQMLQKTQWRTVGFSVVVGSVFFLGYWAVVIIRAWFAAQPNVATDGLDAAYTIGAIVGFIVIPALAWVQVTPERWKQQIEQAHEVKRLELMQRGDLAIVKARLLWAEQRAAVSYANLLPTEQQEIQDTLRGLLMGISDTQRSIARTLEISGELERNIMDDDEIADKLDYVARQLQPPPITLVHGPSRESNVNVETAPAAAHVDTRLQSSIPREQPDATRRHMTTDDDAYLRAAQRTMGTTPWTAKRLAQVLDIGETSARELRDNWIAFGAVREAKQLGRWYFVE